MKKYLSLLLFWAVMSIALLGVTSCSFSETEVADDVKDVITQYFAKEGREVSFPNGLVVEKISECNLLDYLFGEGRSDFAGTVICNIDGQQVELETHSYEENGELYHSFDFSERQKQIFAEAERQQQQAEQLRQQAEAEAQRRASYDWLQGTWTINTTFMGCSHVSRLVIDGNYAKFISDDDVLAKGEIQIYDGELHIGDTYFDLDEDAQRIMYSDDAWFSHSETSSTNVNLGNPQQEQELKLMARIRELNAESKKLIDEFSQIQSRGTIDPNTVYRVEYIKRTVLRNKDEQIRLANQLGDEQMVYELQQQKNTLERAFDMTGF